MDSIKGKKTGFNLEFENFSKSISSILAITILNMTIFHINPSFSLYLTIQADIYALISGLLLTMSLLRDNNKNFSWRNWYKKRIIRIYPALILSTFLILSYRFFTVQRVFEINYILIHISGFQSIPGNPNFELIDGLHWFITFILTCYIIFPVLFILIRKGIKVATYMGFILYIIFIPFSYFFYGALEEFIKLFFSEISILDYINVFVPRYFDFFFGMLLGFRIEQNEKKNLNFLQNSKSGIISFISLMITSSIYIIYCFIVLNIKDEYVFSYYFNYRVLIQPFMTISFIAFFIFLFNDKPKINKILNIPGRKSYEIIMVQTLAMLIILYFIPKILYLDYNIVVVICIILIYLSSIVIAYPIYYFGYLMKLEKKFHSIIIVVSLSLIIYAFIAYILFLFNSIVLNDLLSVLLFSIIFGISIFVYYIKTLIKALYILIKKYTKNSIKI